MTRATPLLLVALAALLTACSGSAADDPAPSTAAATASAGTPTTSAATPAAPSEPVASTYFVPTGELPVARFEPAGAELPIEMPPREEYPIGLSGRTELDGRGMLFAFPGLEEQPGFWMRNTHVDLDIAFIDAAGEIVFITTMQADTDEIHHPGVPYLASIEAPAGWYAEHAIEAGHTVVYPDEAEALLVPE